MHQTVKAKAILCFCHVNMFLQAKSLQKCFISRVKFSLVLDSHYQFVLLHKRCLTVCTCVFVTCLPMHIFFFRERQPDADEDSLTSSPSYPVHGSLTLSAKQEDADNQKNSSRASQAGLNSNAVHIPVTVTAPPGETTIIPSKYSILFFFFFLCLGESN